MNFGRASRRRGAVRTRGRGDRAAEIVEAWFEDGAGERHEYVPQRTESALRARIRFAHPVDDPSVRAAAQGCERAAGVRGLHDLGGRAHGQL